MFTRKDYMEGRCDHSTYYGQFVTESVRNRVAQEIGLERIKASKDPHFNDIPLGEWDRLIGWAGQRVLRPMFSDIPLSKYGENNSCCTHTCIAKEAARQLRDGCV